MSSWADAYIARVDAKGGGCTDLTDLLFGPLLLMDDDDCDKQKCSFFCYCANIDRGKLNLNAVSIGGALHFGGVVVNCGNRKDPTPVLHLSTVTLCVKFTIGGAPVLPYLQAYLSSGSHGDVTTSQKSTSGGLCLTKRIECNTFDQGLVFSVSCKKVQLTDAPVSLLTTLMQMDQGTFLTRLKHQVAIAVVLLPSSPEPSMHLDQPNQGRIKIELPKRRG
jgi:hypothetical protein